MVTWYTRRTFRKSSLFLRAEFYADGHKQSITDVISVDISKNVLKQRIVEMQAILNYRGVK